MLEEAGERGVLVVLVVRLGGAAQRAQVLEHPFGVAAPVGVGCVVALVLVVADEPARQASRSRSRRGRSSGRRRARRGRARAPSPNSTSRIARRLGRGCRRARRRGRWRRSGRRRWCSRAQATSLVTVAAPIPRRGEPIARRNACASSGFCDQRRGRRARRGPRCARTARASRARGAGSRRARARAAAARSRTRCGRARGSRRAGCRRRARRRSAAVDPVRLGELVRRTPALAPGRRRRASRSAPSAPGARCGSRSGRRPRGSPRASGSSARARSARGSGWRSPKQRMCRGSACRQPWISWSSSPTHAQVPVRAGEQVDERRLRVAGVLELVGQDPPPSLPQPREPVRVL